MATAYEWDVEIVAAVDTAELEAGEVIEHRFADSYADARRIAAETHEPGTEPVIVLIRDSDGGGRAEWGERRSWAYLREGKLPAVFENADGDETAHKVPARFHAEVARA